MNLLFDWKGIRPTNKEKIFPRLKKVQNNLEKNIKSIVDYRTFRNKAVRSNHPLIKIIQSINVSPRLDIKLYYDSVVDSMDNIVTANKLSSSYGNGGLYNGVFYNTNCQEMLIADDSYISPMSFSEDTIHGWKHFESIKVLRHDNVYINNMTPEMCTDEDGNNFAIILIDIPLLMLQYREWLKEQPSLDDEEEIGETIYQFVYKYPLTNMIRSHVDVTLFNRLVKINNDEEIPYLKSRSSLALLDITRDVDKVQKQMVKEIIKSNPNWAETMKWFQLSYGSDLKSLAKAPEMVPTRFIKWKLIWATLPYLIFIANIDSQTRGDRDRKIKKDIYKAIEHLDNDNVVPKNFDDELVDRFINELIDLYALVDS